MGGTWPTKCNQGMCSEGEVAGFVQQLGTIDAPNVSELSGKQHLR